MYADHILRISNWDLFELWYELKCYDTMADEYLLHLSFYVNRVAKKNNMTFNMNNMNNNINLVNII